MTITYVISLTSRDRDRRSNSHLGAMLAFIAGAVNAGGFLAVGAYSSHMTGIASSVADFIALNKLDAALTGLLLLFSFTMGAVTTALVVNIARQKKLGSEYAPALMLEALLLLLFGLHVVDSVLFSTAMLCFIMGLQNAVITKISKAVIRTTHITGLVTDIGIELGRYLYRFFSKNSAMTLHPQRLQLYTLLVGAFIGGGVIGALLFQAIGFAMTLPFALFLGALAAMPLVGSARKA